jgi:hypothetical protein
MAARVVVIPDAPQARAGNQEPRAGTKSRHVAPGFPLCASLGGNDTETDSFHAIGMLDHAIDSKMHEAKDTQVKMFNITNRLCCIILKVQ